MNDSNPYTSNVTDTHTTEDNLFEPFHLDVLPEPTPPPPPTPPVEETMNVAPTILVDLALPWLPLMQGAYQAQSLGHVVTGDGRDVKCDKCGQLSIVYKTEDRGAFVIANDPLVSMRCVNAPNRF